MLFSLLLGVGEALVASLRGKTPFVSDLNQPVPIAPTAGPKFKGRHQVDLASEGVNKREKRGPPARSCFLIGQFCLLIYLSLQQTADGAKKKPDKTQKTPKRLISNAILAYRLAV